MLQGVFKKAKNSVFMKRNTLLLCIAGLLPVLATAQNNAPVSAGETSTYWSNPLFIGLLSIIIILMLTIIGLAEVVKATARNRNEQEKRNKTKSGGAAAVILLLAGSLFSTDVFGQAVTDPKNDFYYDYTYWGLHPTLVYGMLLFIAVEIVIILVLYNTAMRLLGVKERREAALKARREAVAKGLPVEPSLMEKFNASVSIDQEKDIMFDHDYDGIRELDNNLPPWWKYGFYATILFAVVYLFHFHILNTGKLQMAEYSDQLATAKAEIEAYKKKAANLVDETNVTLLTDASAIAAGKATYVKYCVACHGAEGQGDVGPNLTDNYWIHGGSIKDVFKSIKFGWPEKGMKSWQQDLGARQIQEVSSYLRTLVGTTPANPKEKQGDLYIEAGKTDSAGVSDSLKAAPDSLPKKDSLQALPGK